MLLLTHVFMFWFSIMLCILQLKPAALEVKCCYKIGAKRSNGYSRIYYTINCPNLSIICLCVIVIVVCRYSHFSSWH